MQNATRRSVPLVVGIAISSAPEPVEHNKLRSSWKMGLELTEQFARAHSTRRVNDKRAFPGVDLKRQLLDAVAVHRLLRTNVRILRGKEILRTIDIERAQDVLRADDRRVRSEIARLLVNQTEELMLDQAPARPRKRGGGDLATEAKLNVEAPGLSIIDVKSAKGCATLIGIEICRTHREHSVCCGGPSRGRWPVGKKTESRSSSLGHRRVLTADGIFQLIRSRER